MVGARELEQLCSVALTAGAAILRVYGEAFDVQHKADASLLTQADLRAEESIQQGLAKSFPGVPVWSEEATKPESAADSFLLVDPLDGTREFVGRNGEFTVNIAWIDRGRPMAAVVYAPAFDELFYAAEGEGAWHRASSGAVTCLAPASATGLDRLRVLRSRSHSDDVTDQWLQALRQPVDVVDCGSSLKFCRLAQGVADLYPRFGPTCQWDTAAGDCVLTLAGGAVVRSDGSELMYGMDLPTLNPFFVAASRPVLLAALPSFPVG